MVGRVSVPPKLHPLDCPKSPDVPVRVGPAVDVGPDDVDVKPIDQVPVPDVALQLDGALDGCEFVFDLDVLVVQSAVRCGVPYAMGLLEGQVQL